MHGKWISDKDTHLYTCPFTYWDYNTCSDENNKKRDRGDRWPVLDRVVKEVLGEGNTEVWLKGQCTGHMLTRGLVWWHIAAKLPL